MRGENTKGERDENMGEYKEREGGRYERREQRGWKRMRKEREIEARKEGTTRMRTNEDVDEDSEKGKDANEKKVFEGINIEDTEKGRNEGE